GYYRIQIWTYGTASVERNPWFGIGDKAMGRAHWMVMETIDNHWLMLAVRYGLPTAILFGLGVVWALWRCGATHYAWIVAAREKARAERIGRELAGGDLEGWPLARLLA
ncbi:MAG: hypothetical protein IH968_10395, partial [Gemmatimonadetes bacterium]|nr:hypothetical protein [Gemmatimonadota bacterium]